MGRPAKHDHATREALLDAAERLLASAGPEAVSVRAAADASNVSTRAVYSVLGSKDALLRGLAARGFGYLSGLVEALPVIDDPLADLVAAGTDGFRTFAIGRPHLFRITFDRMSPDVIQQPDVFPQLRRSLAALTARIDRALASGDLGRRSPHEVAFMFHSICHGLAVNELSRMPPPLGSGVWRMTEGMDVAGLWRTTLEAFVHGLADAA